MHAHAKIKPEIYILHFKEAVTQKKKILLVWLLILTKMLVYS